MSWKRKKKEIKNVKHKVKLIIGLMFAVVIGLMIFLCFKFISQKDNYYKIEPRTDNISKEVFKDSSCKTISWLRVQGTDIDYPIVHCTDYDKGFPVELESFAWSRNKTTEFNNRIDIAGHNIFNLSAKPIIKSEYFNRFEELMAFVYYDFAKDNEYIQLTIDGEDYLYKIFSAGFISPMATSFLSNDDNPSKDQLKDDLKIIKERSLYKYDVDVNENDKIISLSTCTRFYGEDEKLEFYVHGRLLRKGEKVNHYKVTKNSNYKEVEKILKGDDK